MYLMSIRLTELLIVSVRRDSLFYLFSLLLKKETNEQVNLSRNGSDDYINASFYKLISFKVMELKLDYKTIPSIQPKLQPPAFCQQKSPK